MAGSMSTISWVSELIGGGASKIIDSISGAAKKFITTDQDKMTFELEVGKANFELKKLEIEAESKRLEDVQSAREMFSKTDNSIQKIFALTFLSGYIILTIAMLWFIMGWVGLQKIIIPDWSVALISTIYGTMSAKISTIIDFFFGSSKGSHDKDDAVSNAFSLAMKGKNDDK
jgi:hypothetical protein